MLQCSYQNHYLNAFYIQNGWVSSFILNINIKVLFKREAGHETYLILILARANFCCRTIMLCCSAIKENNSTFQDNCYN
jgi:hypothetical protein